MSGVKLVCFDWGGVILQICRSWPEGCQRARLPIRGDTNDPAWANQRRGVARAFQEGLITRDEFYDRLSHATERLYSPAEVAAIHDAWLVAEYPGVDRVVATLNATPGLTTALLSNTNEAHWDRQLPKPDGRPGDFPTAFALQLRHASHFMGLIKPEDAIYQEFERLTGFTGPEILFFDDLAENIAAARARGWLAEQIDHTGDTAGQMLAALRRHAVL